ncbi:MAG TPA: histidine kinase, partial [Phnomibacter sp.]|nr:histidine kinase [Phnomibacter sp.]
CEVGPSFTIMKPWWRTNTFMGLVTVAVLLSAGAFRRYKRKKREADEMKKAVNYFALSGRPYSNTEDILWDIARNCIGRLGFEDCVIYLVDEGRNRLIQKAAYGNKQAGENEVADPIEIEVGKGITGYAALHGITVLVNDTTRDARYIVDDRMRHSELAVPILHEGQVIGVIDSEHHRKRFFTGQHRQTVEQIAAICASKIARTLALEKMKQAEHKLEQLNIRMMEERFMNLRLQMNPHFLFNTLTSIQYLIVSGQEQKASRYLNVFSTFLRALLQFAEVNVVTLQEELRILKLYVELESLSLDETFNYEIHLDEEIDPEEMMVPFMILQPFVENAILHGLLHRLGEKFFSITIRSYDDDRMVCTIEDNGVGRQRSAEINAAKMQNSLHESKGINIVNQRLALLAEKTGRSGGVEYEDLFDEKGRPSGTRVTITIPYYFNIEV